MSERIELVVPTEQSGVRLDRFLARELAEISRTRIQELMDEGRVLVDGAAMKPSHKVEEGATVVIDIPPTLPAGVEAENIPLDLIYEDDDIAVINKPAGIIVHPGAGADTGTLVAALLHRFGGVSGLSTIGGPLRSGIVHRLDKETSGAIVIARNDAAHRKLVKDFQSRLVEKTYVALLHGKLKGEKGTVDLPVARDLHRRARMTARRREGREARTDWKTRLHLDGFTLIEANLHTGRTHQIRVHFSAIAHPVVGDTLYGAASEVRVSARTELHASNEQERVRMPALGRNFLHAARLGFSQPRTGAWVEVRAPLPEALHEFARKLAVAAGEDSERIDAVLAPYL
jgi:23S rRNA pseudouridine1911/1915/1917 synthase